MDKQNEINLKDMTDVEFEKKLRTAVIAKELNDFFEKTPIELTYNHDNGEVDIIKEKQALKVLDDITKQAIIPFVAEVLVGLGYRKIDENVVVLTDKEYKRYERIEKIIKLAKREKANGYEVKNGKVYYFSNMLGGCEIEFNDLQEICNALNHYNEEFWGLDQRLAFWQGKAETIGKETAEKFAERLKSKLEKFAIKIMREEYQQDAYVYMVDSSDIDICIDKTCKEITEGKNGETLHRD